MRHDRLLTRAARCRDPGLTARAGLTPVVFCDGKLHGEDYVRYIVGELSRVRGVMARIRGIDKVINPRPEREIVDIRKQGRACVPPVPAGEVVEIGIVTRIVGGNYILETHVVVVQERPLQVGVGAERCAVRKRQVVDTAAEALLAVKEWRMRWSTDDG